MPGAEERVGGGFALQDPKSRKGPRQAVGREEVSEVTPKSGQNKARDIPETEGLACWCGCNSPGAVAYEVVGDRPGLRHWGATAGP